MMAMSNQRLSAMYGYQCEYCEGTVREQLVEHEVFKHCDGCDA